MLQCREEQLRQRRLHVEHLIRWHQRLDDEEQDVLAMEHQLMTRTNTVRSKGSSETDQRLKQIANIEHSLEVLQSMSGRRSVDNKSTKDRINMSGSKLNRLWRRLTGDATLKFDSTKRYVLTKVDIERLYEDAKLAVLAQFNDGDPKVLEQTMNSTLAPIETPADGNRIPDEFIVVPSLNLELTSAEELSSITTDAEQSDTAGQGYYFSDYAPRSSELSKNEAIENSNVSDCTSSKSKSNPQDSIKSDPPNSKSTSIVEVLSAYMVMPNDLPNETFIDDISCPPFEISENSVAPDVDATITVESSNLVCRDLKNEDDQLTVNTQIESFQINTNSLSDNTTVESSIIEEEEMLASVNIEKSADIQTQLLVMEETKSFHESPTTSYCVSENSEGSSTIQSEEVGEESAISTMNTVEEDSLVDHLNDVSISENVCSHVDVRVVAAQDLAPRDYVGPLILEKAVNKMPDIISEAEVLRRQQMEIEQEVIYLIAQIFTLYMGSSIPNRPKKI